jgi:hypothetical protein
MMKMTEAFQDSMAKLSSKVTQITTMLENKQRIEFVKGNKHLKIGIEDKRIFNEASDLNEVRWALIGHSILSCNYNFN